MKESNGKFIRLFVGSLVAVVLPSLDFGLRFTSYKIDPDAKFDFLFALPILLFVFANFIFELFIEENKGQYKALKEQNERQFKELKETYERQNKELREVYGLDKAQRQKLYSDVDYLIRLNTSTISSNTLSKSELYDKLNEFTKNAKTSLELMYLGEKPPHELAKLNPREKFDSTLDEVINGQKVNVTRTVLLTETNAVWVDGMINSYQHKRTFSLYILEHAPILPLSIQVIDNDKVVLIYAVKRNNVERKHLYMESGDAKTIFHGYYSEITKGAISIIENGKLNKSMYNQYIKSKLPTTTS